MDSTGLDVRLLYGKCHREYTASAPVAALSAAPKNTGEDTGATTRGKGEKVRVASAALK